MEEIKQHYFDGDEVKTQLIAEDILQKPGEAKEILDCVLKYSKYLSEKKALEHKYKHKLRELHEEYGIEFTD